jgi:hypothetical protein
MLVPERALGHTRDVPALRRLATPGPDGVGLWEFEDREGRTAVRFHGTVATTRRWMQLLEPVARPVFVANHHAALRRLVEALARSLDAGVVDHDAWEVRPRHRFVRDLVVPTLAEAVSRERGRTS